MSKIIFIAFLFCTLFAEINITQYQDPAYLKKLLHTLDQNSSKDEKILLEKTLIQKILTKEPVTSSAPQLNQPKSQKELLNVIKKSLELLKNLSDLHQQIDDLKQKIASLQEQLQKQNDPILALQLVYNQKRLQSLEKEKKSYQNRLQKIKLFLSSPPPLDPKELQKNITALQSKIRDRLEELQNLKLKIERYRLINDDKSVQYLQKIYDAKRAELQNLQTSLLANEIALFLAKLQIKSKESVALEKKVLAQLPNDEAKEFFTPFFSQLTKEKLGFFNTVKLSTFETLKNWLKQTLHYLQQPFITLGNKEISLLQLTIALFWLFIGFIIGALYKRSINRIESRSISSSTKTLLANVGYYLLLLLFFFIALNTLQIDLSSIALIAGALSVGIGFGLQNIVSNFVSGIILMFERSIKIGDYIEIDENLRGRVTDIRMRSTTINTNDNIDIVIPNQTFIQSNLINWTMNDRIRRFQVPFGVAYGTEPQKVIDVVLAAVKRSGFKDIVETRKRQTRVIMTGMGNSSVNFKLFVWIKGEEVFYPERTISRFLILIYNALYEAGIEIPFPQRDLHIRSIDQNAILNINVKESDGSASSSNFRHR